MRNIALKNYRQKFKHNSRSYSPLSSSRMLKMTQQPNMAMTSECRSTNRKHTERKPPADQSSTEQLPPSSFYSETFFFTQTFPYKVSSFQMHCTSPSY